LKIIKEIALSQATVWRHTGSPRREKTKQNKATRMTAGISVGQAAFPRRELQFLFKTENPTKFVYESYVVIKKSGRP
jgi:hypothetical protein